MKRAVLSFMFFVANFMVDTDQFDVYARRNDGDHSVVSNLLY